MKKFLLLVFTMLMLNNPAVAMENNECDLKNINGAYHPFKYEVGFLGTVGVIGLANSVYEGSVACGILSSFLTLMAADLYRNGNRDTAVESHSAAVVEAPHKEQKKRKAKRAPLQNYVSEQAE